MTNLRKSIIVLVLGIVLVTAGCVPFGIAIKNRLDVKQVVTQVITVDKNYQSPIIYVDTQNYIKTSIKIHLTTNEIHRDLSSRDNEYDGKFRFPLTLSITDKQAKKIYEYTGKLEWNKGHRSYDMNDVGSQHAELVVEMDLDKIKAPVSGVISIDVLLGKDKFYYAKIHQAELIVYDNVHTYTSTIVTGVVFIVLGFIVAIIGLLMILIKITNKPVANAQQNSTATDSRTTQSFSEEIANPGLSQQKQENSDQNSINTAAMFCHLASFAGFVVPLGGVLGPLIVWSINKDRHPFINRHGIAAVNFHLSMFLYYSIGFVLIVILIGFFILPVLGILDLVLTIIAAIKANEGKNYQYPMTILFIKCPKSASEL